MNATKIFLAGALMFALTGCGKSKALAAAEEYETAACACKTADCATAATKAYGEKTAETASTMKSGEVEAMTKATTAAAACVMKISMAGLPGMPH
jgi:hypothetical protein